MFKEMSLQAFADAAASREPVPGGGSVSALAGGLAAALAAMVATLTLTKDAFADRAPEMQRLHDAAEDLREELLDAADRDAQSYRDVLAAYRRPKTTEEERRQRSAAIQAAFRHATEVPLQVAEAAIRVLELAATATRRGNPDMLTDAGVGVVLARSAALGALMNAKFNLTSLKDKAFVAQARDRIERLRQRAIQMESEVLASLGSGDN
jgi:methenyltetrahydrofolate cyclohydrolase